MQQSIHADKDTGLHRLNPLTKLALAGFLLFGAMIVPGQWQTYLIWLVVVVPLAVWGRILSPFLRIALIATLPFAISIFLIQGFLWPGGTPLVWIGPFSLKAEGWLFTIRFVGRILLINSAFLLIALTTRADHLMRALVEKGLPTMIAYIVLTTIQIAPRFQAKARTILGAQRSRGLETEGGLLRRMRALLPLVIPLVLGSLVDIEERAIALEARAFSRTGTRTSLFDIPDSAAQRVFRWSLLGIAAIMLASRVLLI
jgi:energy-coupling factor transport system permease protein